MGINNGYTPSIILALSKSNIQNISLTNRTYEKSLFLQKKFKNITLIKWSEYSKKLKEFDFIINATSLGLKLNDHFKRF